MLPAEIPCLTRAETSHCHAQTRGYTATVGLKTDANLKGNEYSTLSSIAAYAQLACQPLGAFLLVRFPINRLLAVLMFCWGGVLMGMAGATNFPVRCELSNSPLQGCVS
jgi:hypothetical protein